MDTETFSSQIKIREEFLSSAPELVPAHAASWQHVPAHHPPASARDRPPTLSYSPSSGARYLDYDPRTWRPSYLSLPRQSTLVIGLPLEPRSYPRHASPHPRTATLQQAHGRHSSSPPSSRQRGVEFQTRPEERGQFHEGYGYAQTELHDQVSRASERAAPHGSPRTLPPSVPSAHAPPLSASSARASTSRSNGAYARTHFAPEVSEAIILSARIRIPH